jgi:hypothetical protein
VEKRRRREAPEDDAVRGEEPVEARGDDLIFFPESALHDFSSLHGLDSPLPHYPATSSPR